MTNLELFNTLSQQWLSIDEIMKITNGGRDCAIKIRNNIEQEIIKSGKILPRTRKLVVPTKKVIEYLGLDLDYIVSMAKNEAEIYTKKGEFANAGISR